MQESGQANQVYEGYHIGVRIKRKWCNYIEETTGRAYMNLYI